MISFELNILQSAGVGALALILGIVLTRKITLLQRFCIPSPVSGGIVFSFITLALYTFFDIEVLFDGTLKDIFMTAFFTSVGFQCDMKVLRQGGRPLITMLILIVVLVSMQNFIATGIAKLVDINPLIGMAAGSLSMTGGHGTAGGFSSVLEEMGLQGAETIAMAAATFGLVAGSMLGGPLAELIIRKKLTQEQVQEKDENMDPAMAGIETEEFSPRGLAKHVSTNELEFQQYAKATYLILLTMGGGTILSWLITKTGIAVPSYFGTLILAAIIRNIIGFFTYEKNGVRVSADKKLDMDRIVSVGNICLSLFLGMAMISLKFWELQSLALPLIAILAAQVFLMALFTYFIAFPMLGRNYDAAVLCAGICGFGLGATPNAMANMSAVCYKYHYTVNPFLIVPIIGVMFSDLINTAMITLFLNFM